MSGFWENSSDVFVKFCGHSRFRVCGDGKHNNRCRGYGSEELKGCYQGHVLWQVVYLAEASQNRPIGL